MLADGRRAPRTERVAVAIPELVGSQLITNRIELIFEGETEFSLSAPPLPSVPDEGETDRELDVVGERPAVGKIFREPLFDPAREATVNPGRASAESTLIGRIFG